MIASVFFLCVFLLSARPSAGRVSDFHGNPGKIKDGSPRFMGEETESSEVESTLPRGRAASEQLSRDLKPSCLIPAIPLALGVIRSRHKTQKNLSTHFKSDGHPGSLPVLLRLADIRILLAGANGLGEQFCAFRPQEGLYS